MEYEVKLAGMSSETLDAILRDAQIGQAMAETVRSIPMETTYYDTADGSLGAKCWTLRRRMEGGTPVVTLKTPAPQKDCRNEWETECESIENAIPILCKLGAPDTLRELTAGGVEQVCAARFTRLAKTVEAPGCTVELALDQGVLLGGGREAPFAEIEVELKDGTEEAAVVFAQALAAAFGLVSEAASKYKRALALTKETSTGDSSPHTL